MNKEVFSPEEIKSFEEDFTEKVKELNDLELAEVPGIETRNQQVEELLDIYLGVTGETPGGRVLRYLSDYILIEDIKDSNPHKTLHTEYPLQSEYSKKFTTRRELSVSADILDYLHSKYTKRLTTLTKVSRKNKEEV